MSGQRENRTHDLKGENCFVLTTEPRAFRKALLVFVETVLPEDPVAVLLHAEGEVPNERLRCFVESNWKHST